MADLREKVDSGGLEIRVFDRGEVVAISYERSVLLKLFFRNGVFRGIDKGKLW